MTDRTEDESRPDQLQRASGRSQEGRHPLSLYMEACNSWKPPGVRIGKNWDLCSMPIRLTPTDTSDRFLFIGAVAP